MVFDMLAAIGKDETTGGTFVGFANEVPIIYEHTDALKMFEFAFIELSPHLSILAPHGILTICNLTSHIWRTLDRFR